MQYRKHIRLSNYDYSSSNYYFVTICTKQRKEMFVSRLSKKYDIEISTNVAAPSYGASYSSIIEKVLEEFEEVYYQNLEIGFFCIMPDHVHMILAFHDVVIKRGAKSIICSCTACPCQHQKSGDHKGRGYSLGQIIGAFKSITTRKLWNTGYKGRLWQPNFYEHIIRSDNSLEKIRHYIANNPSIEYNQIPWNSIDQNR